MTSSMNRPSLREELGVSRDPDFELTLLPGWERRTPDAEDLADREAALKKRFMELHRPDLFVEARQMLRESHEVMTKEKAIAYFLAAAEESDETFWVPGSIVATIRTPPAGSSLDLMVVHAIRKFGAAPLFEDRRFIRFEREQTIDLQGGTIVQKTINYMTPIPGSGRRRALQLTAAFGRMAGVEAQEQRARGITVAFDVCVSSLRWIKSTP